MKLKMSLVSALVVALFGAQAMMAHAQTPKTRAEVNAECAQAKAEGKVIQGECDVTAQKELSSTKTTKTRAAVKSEAKAAPKTPGETAANPKPDMTKSTKTRAEVKAECEMAKKEGKAVPPGECQ
jgi:Tfp pilus assembly protein PilX